MLDPGFGYEPNLPRSNMGATYDRLLQERYRTLWDITVAGRLFQYGWLPASIREKHWTIFKNIFPGSVEDLESVFSFFFNNISPKHPELVSFSLTPEAWFASSNSKAISKGMCSLCHFPAHHLIDASISLSPSLIDAIQKEYPNWNPTESICRQCADLYELRTDTG